MIEYLNFNYDPNVWEHPRPHPLDEDQKALLKPSHIEAIKNCKSIMEVNATFLSGLISKLLDRDMAKLQYSPESGNLTLFTYYEYAFFDYGSYAAVPVLGEDMLILLNALTLDQEHGHFAYMVYKARKEPVFDIDEWLRHSGWDYELLPFAAFKGLSIQNCFKGKI